jgi:hypothetical protein
MMTGRAESVTDTFVGERQTALCPAKKGVRGANAWCSAPAPRTACRSFAAPRVAHRPRPGETRMRANCSEVP